MNPDEWLVLIQERINAGDTVATVARMIGVSRSTLSGIINRTATSPYVTGAASTDGIRDRALATLGTVKCPHRAALAAAVADVQGDAVALPDGIWIARQQCRQDALCNAPMGNLVQMEQWRACQTCDNRPQPLLMRPVVPRGPKKAAPATSTTNQTDLFNANEEAAK